MRTLGRAAVFPCLTLLIALLCVWIAPSAAFAQSPPKIPGLPGFGRPPAEPAVVFGDSRDQVDVTVSASRDRVEPGEDLPIALRFKVARGYHIWTAPSTPAAGFAQFESAIRTEITLNPDASGKSAPLAGVAFHEAFLQWPTPHSVEADLGEGLGKYEVYEGEFYAFLPASIAADAAVGARELPLEVSFQACNDKGCSAPASVTVVVKFEVVAAGSAPSAALGSAFKTFDPSVYARIGAGAAPSKIVKFSFFWLHFTLDPSGNGIVLLLFVAAVGGLLLNLTPCVLPVIPLKIIGLSRAAQGSRAKCFLLGCIMSLGVIGFWMGLGLAIASVKSFTSTNQLFQTPWFTIGVGTVIGIMAIGMAGFFSLQLPNWVHSIEAKHDSYLGSALFGVMTAVLSTPCTAPLMGTAVAWATTEGPTMILLVFGAVGVGMAFPFVVLSASPKLIDHMPRTGPASDLIKQVMGLLLLGAAAYFVGAGVSGLMVTPPEPPSHIYWWIVAALGTAAGVWLLVRTVRITKKTGHRVVFGGVGAFVAAISVLIGVTQTATGPIDWIYYTPERLAAAQADGQVVVVDFTAEWCANCKTLEALVLNTSAVAEVLNSDGVAAIKVDLTGNNEAGNALLKASNRVTIPLLLVYGRDGTLVLNASEYTAAQVLEAIAAARRGGGAVGE